MIDIIALNEYHLDRSCIYRIWFGWKYYIGATLNSTYRMTQHQSTLKRAFNGTGLGKNSVTNIVNHVMINKFIKTAYFEMLEECFTEFDLVDAEHKWLSPCEGDVNCLNERYKVHRTINGVIYRPNGDFTIIKKDHPKCYAGDLGSCNST